MAKLKLEVSLDDAWADQAWKSAAKCADGTQEREFLRVALGRCALTSSGAVIDPNGNRIGRVEVVDE